MESPRPLTPDSAVTPFRETRTVLGGAEYALTRQKAHFARRGDEIYPAVAGEVGDASGLVLDPESVYYLRTCGWILSPQLLQPENQLLTSAALQMVDGTEFADVAPGIASYYRWSKPAIQGVSYDPDVANQARPAYVREGAAGDDYGQELTADAAAFPPPGLPGINPLKRVFAGTKTYPANQALLFEFFVPNVGENGGYLYGISFGGPADTLPRGSLCEGWYVAFRGDGVATMWERVNRTWRRRKDFRWSEAGRARVGWQYLVIYPHKTDKLIFLVPSAAGALGADGGSPLSPRSLPLRRPDTHFQMYHHSAARTGHSYQEAITGWGCVRVDMRADMAGRFAVGATRYPTGGAFVDRPLPLKQRVPAGSVMRLHLKSYQPAGTSVTPGIYDADTGEECPLGLEPNTWLTVDGQQRYCVKCVLQGDGLKTPTVEDYSVELEAQFEQTIDTAVEGPGPDSVNLTPGGGDPTLDGGFLAYTDLLDQLSRLKNRGSVPLQLITTIDDAGTESCLFKGRTLGASRRVLYETDGGELPVYEAEVIGRWARLQEQKTQGLITKYAIDPDASPDSIGDPNPWRVTAVIKDLLSQAGVTDAEMHIPLGSSDLRLWPSKTIDAYAIPANTSYLALAQELARNYLDAYLIYDPNSGVSGMWRLIFNPERPDENILWQFVDTATVEYTVGGDPIPNLPHTPDAYEEGVTYIEEIHFERFLPEANHIIVRGLAAGSTSPDNALQVLASKHNPKSFTIDPDHPTATDPEHPDYVGYEILEAFTDATVQSKEEAAWLCARIYDLIAHGRKVASLVAPLVFATDSTDPVQTQPRPLRFGDPVLVNGNTGVVKACLPFYTSDRKQMARMQVVMVPEGETRVKSFGPSLSEQARHLAQATAAEPFARSAHQRIWNTGVHGVAHDAEIANLPIAPGGSVELTTKDGKELFVIGKDSPFSTDTVLAW